jgi:hypothetical protein
MRRLLFVFSCGCLGWVLLGVRDVAPIQRPSASADETSIESFIHRREVVSSQFTAAFTRAEQRVRHANRVLGRAAAELNRLTGG